jgi:predicted dithiol-disulfide oxidoreductase (DUF899 family)
VASDVDQRIALASIARSTIQRLVAFKKERGWNDLKVYSDVSGNYTRRYVSSEDAYPKLEYAEKETTLPNR